MSAIIECVSATGQSISTTIHDSSGNLWNGAAFEVFNSANWATYLTSLTEQGTSGYYKGSFPAGIAAGKYTYVLYPSATYGEVAIGSGQIYWSGSIEEQGIGKVLETYKLDKVISATAGATPPTIGSYLDQIMNKDAGQTFSQSVASLQAIQSGGSSGPTAIQIANQVWDTVLTGVHTIAGSGAAMLEAILAVLPSSGIISNFDAAATGVNLNASQTGVTIGTVNALGTSAASSVLTQIRTGLTTDTISELSGVPGTTPTLTEALMLLYMSLRNEHTATSSQEKIKNNAGTAIATASVSDNGTTYTKGRFS